MQAEVKRHAHRVTTGQPAVCAPRCEQEHALDRLLAHNRPKERRARDTLRLFEAAVEAGRERAGTRTDLGGYGEDGVECPRCALLEALVSIVGRIEKGDKDMASREETE